MLKKSHQIAVILALLGSVMIAFYFWQKYDALKKNPEKVAQDEAKQIVAKLGQLALLPQGEEPTVATVTEPDKLKNQPFFIRAEKGDKLLIYNAAGKAYLYRPSIGKIIDATSFNPNQVEQVQKQPEPAQTTESVAPAAETEGASVDKKSKTGN
jgi:hypothetical protein